MTERTDDEIDAIARGALREPEPAGETGDPETEPIDPGVLLDYRAGRLDASAIAAVEARLIADPEARAILRELAEPVPPAKLFQLVAEMPAPPPAEVSAAMVWFAFPLSSRKFMLITEAVALWIPTSAAVVRII